MRVLAAISIFVGTCVLVACGGSSPPAEAPEPIESPEDVTQPTASAPSSDEGAPPKDEAKPEQAPVGEPQFTEGMSVEEAVKAVPQGSERANIDPETLGKPLQDFAVYEPCKPGSAHFKLRIAVWDGKVVGSDVTTTPKNDKLTACIKDRLKTLTWQAKVKSLNTVDYSF